MSECNSITSKLLREQMDFIQTRVDTICVKEFSQGFLHLGRRLGPFKLGHNYNLPYYIARIMVEEGILKFDEKTIVNSTSIQKINFQESTDPELHQVDDHIYVQGVEQLKVLNIFQKHDKIPRREFNQLFSDLNDLIRVRLAKLSRLSIATQGMKTKSLLSSEEKILYEELSKGIKEWRDFLSKVE